MKMEKSAQSATILIALITLLQLAATTNSEPRSEIIELTCDQQRQNNQTVFIPNFVNMMERIGIKVRTSLIGTAVLRTGPDTNYGLAQCYGDLTTQDCISCYSAARTFFPTCFPNNGGRVYLDGCFMRMQNYSFYEEYTGPDDTVICGNYTRKDGLSGEAMERALVTAVKDVMKSGEYFARVYVPVRGRNESAYVLADCLRTLSPRSCKACLENASASISKCLLYSEGRALNTGCIMRFSDTNFLNHPTSRSINKGKKIIPIVVLVVGSLVGFTVAVLVSLYVWSVWKHMYIQKKQKEPLDAQKLLKMLTDKSFYFKYSTIKKATENWDESNKLRQGGFGTVYKGVLGDGREIAVKRLYFNSKFRAVDVYNEVNINSSLEHKNLVRLLGCCCWGPESILVYEYLPNMSLDRFIFDATEGKALYWEKRLDIIIGTAEGLVYLHENDKCRIIHRDIKASNILLDSRLRAKIADFGLARSFQDDKSHISAAIAGTLGYMAPEYLFHGQLTEKADVYSFGVLILEVVSGMENNRRKTKEYTDNLVSIVWNHFLRNKMEEIFDPNLMMHLYPNNCKKDAIKVVQVGLLCTQEDPSLRPLMSIVLKMLIKDDEPLPIPSNPPFIDEKTMELNDIIIKTRDHFHGDDSASVATVDHSHFFPR